jgi:hypothetical protein
MLTVSDTSFLFYFKLADHQEALGIKDLLADIVNYRFAEQGNAASEDDDNVTHIPMMCLYEISLNN